jgi:ketosteroid isomerase-like protein
MASDTPYVALLRAAYRLWSDSKGNSADQWMAICAEGIKFGSLAHGPHGAPYLTAYQGREMLVEYFSGLKRDWDMIDFVAENFVAQDDRVVMLGRCSWRYRATGKTIDTPKADSWRFADGRAIEFFEYFDTAQLRDAMS